MSKAPVWKNIRENEPVLENIVKEALTLSEKVLKIKEDQLLKSVKDLKRNQ